MKTQSLRQISGRVYAGSLTHLVGGEVVVTRLLAGQYDLVTKGDRIVSVVATCDQAYALRFVTAQLMSANRVQINTYNMAEARFEGSFFFTLTLAS